MRAADADVRRGGLGYTLAGVRLSISSSQGPLAMLLARATVRESDSRELS